MGLPIVATGDPEARRLAAEDHVTILAWGGLLAALVLVALLIWATRDEYAERRERREWWAKRERR